MIRNKLGLGLLFLIFITGVILMNAKIKDKESIITNDNKDHEVLEKKLENNPLNTMKPKDNYSIYRKDEDSYVYEIYVTVLPPRKENSITFNELNTVTDYKTNYVKDANDPVAEVIFHGDSLNQESLAMTPNATIELRGQSSRKEPQKSYKIKLYDNTDKWYDFKTINLNKHYYDPSRIRNKLSYDYFEVLPDFISLRTRFVKLYIKDLSSQQKDNGFKSYGLYTFIEQPNKSFLRRHNLDPNGSLYKAEFFEFYRDEAFIKSTSAIDYSKEEFEKVLEVMEGGDHEKLIEMLEALNDYNQNINTVVDKYFDRDNLLTWMAVNILFDSYDTNSRNFILYSSVNSDKWYFVPWDYDKTWLITDSRGKWQKGLANYWGMVLFNRFFKDPNNIEALGQKIEELTKIINEDRTKQLLDSYHDSVVNHLFISPDRKHLETTISEYNKEYYELSQVTEKTKKDYYESLENPMPFYLHDPIKDNTFYKFAWNPAYDLQGDELTYSFILSRDYEFKSTVANYEGLTKTSCIVTGLNKGDYYWKVIAYDSKGNFQEAFDYVFEDGHTRFGVKKLQVE